MPVETRRPVPPPEETPEQKSARLRSQITTYLENFARAIEETQGPNNVKPHSPEDFQVRVDETMVFIDRNDFINRELNSERYNRVREKERHQKANVIMAATACVDPRVPRYIFGREISMIKVPQGEITTIRRPSDNKRIPKSATLRQGIRNAAESDRELFEFFFVHTDTINNVHGCSGMGNVLADLDGHDSIDFNEKHAISQEPTAVDANIRLSVQTTEEAITNYYNICRKMAGKVKVARVGITAIYDTDTIGIIVRKDGEDLSTTDLTNKHLDEISTLSGQQGKYAETFTDERYLLDFLEDVADTTETLLNSDNQLVQEVDKFLQKHYSDLTGNQHAAARWGLVRMCSVKYLIGNLQNVNGKPNHSFVDQVADSPISISLNGEALGEFDTKQHFWSSPGSIKAAISETDLQTSVVRKIPGHSTKPTAVFVCSSADDEDASKRNKGYGRTLELNEMLVDELVVSREVGTLLLNDKIIIIPTVISDTTRLVIEIPDHTGSF